MRKKEKEARGAHQAEKKEIEEKLKEAEKLKGELEELRRDAEEALND